MTDLVQSRCVPCRGGVPTLTREEIADLLPQTPHWRATEAGGVSRIEREFAFADFKEAMAFAVKAGEIAESEGHHPDIHVAWGKVRVETWTHKIKGLHRNDFVLAAKIDAAYSGRSL